MVRTAVVALGIIVMTGHAYADDAKAPRDAAISADAQQARPASEPAVPKEVPKDVSGAIDAGKQQVELAKAGKWFAFSAGCIYLLMFLIKLGRKHLGFMRRIPKRVLWILIPLLSLAAMLLSKFQGDLSWSAAIAVLMSGPGAAFINDLVKRGILNKEPSPMNGPPS